MHLQGVPIPSFNQLRAVVCALALSVFVSSVTFASGGWDGVNGSYDGSGTRGGNAGVINITVPGLFNTTNARFIGRGGYTTLAGTAGGNGGVFQINYHGLIRNFTQSGTNGLINITRGSSVGGTNGTNGSIVYVKDSAIPRDADVNGNGLVNSADINILINLYNNVTSDSTYNINVDINNDGIINVLDLVYVGFEYDTRN